MKTTRMLAILVLALGLTAEVANADFTFGTPTKVPSVNTPGFEIHPDISADGLSLYFASSRSGGQGGFDLWVATRKTKDGKWGQPQNLGPTVNSPDSEWCPRVSADGLSLYFGSTRPGGSGGRDLWVTTRPTKNDPWGAPVNLGPTVNSEADDLSACPSADGLSLFFHSKRAGGSGLQDLWVTTRPTKDDPWGEPVNLGPNVNSPDDDGDGCISADGLALFFFSSRPGGYGHTDLWVTTRKTTEDAWGKPVNLGPKVNSEAREWFPSISADGSTLYFFSDRPTLFTQTDIWQASIAAKQEHRKGIEGLWDMVKYRWGNMKEFIYCEDQNIRNLKVTQGGIYIVVRYNSATGEVLRSHGGTYTFDGENLNSEVTFASERVKDYIGKKSSFKIDLEGDTFFLSGLLAGDMKLEEKWIRVK